MPSSVLLLYRFQMITFKIVIFGIVIDFSILTRVNRVIIKDKEKLSYFLLWSFNKQLFQSYEHISRNLNSNTVAYFKDDPTTALLITAGSTKILSANGGLYLCSDEILPIKTVVIHFVLQDLEAHTNLIQGLSFGAFHRYPLYPDCWT